MANSSTSARLTGSTEESLILTLLDLANHLTRNGGHIAREEGLTAQQWLLLLQIAGDPNFPMLGETCEAGTPVLASNIATARGVSRPTISALVASLVEKGLVSQAEKPGDRRQKALRATPAGMAVLARIEPARRRANKALLAEFEAEEIELVLRVLRSCLDELWSQQQRFGAGASGTETETDAGKKGE
ncbi:MAG: MarR family transcriptional regulator [Thermoanaerobaculales bacterium]|jgi:DNA-binding MarR family transcriptional regulator|nr:MarR family transcriptional regulator [Thermoanaerobaculales bacterium]